MTWFKHIYSFQGFLTIKKKFNNNCNDTTPASESFNLRMWNGEKLQ